MSRFIGGEWVPPTGLCVRRHQAAVASVNRVGVTGWRWWHPLYGTTALVVFRPAAGHSLYGTYCRVSFWDVSAEAVARRAAADLRGWLATPNDNYQIEAKRDTILHDLEGFNYKEAQMSGSGWYVEGVVRLLVVGLLVAGVWLGLHLREQATAAQAELTQAKEDRKALAGAVSPLTTEVTELRKKLETTASDVKALDGKVNTASEKTEALKTSLESTTKALTDLKGGLDKAVDALNDAKNSAKAVGDDVKSIKDDLGAAKTALGEIKDKVGAIDGKLPKKQDRPGGGGDRE